MNTIFTIPKSTILDTHVTSVGFATVGQVAQWKPEYNFIFNGDGWYSGTSASIWYSEGVGKNTKQLDWRPWLNFDKSNNYKFGWMWGTFWGNFNAVSGTRFIVENGAINSKWERWSTEKNARTAVGIDAYGNLVVAIIDGRDKPAPSLGLSLKELADAMLDKGCVTAIDLDGGGSTTLAINGTVANEPNDDGVPGQRAVVNHVCLRLSEIPGHEPPPEPEPEPPPDTTSFTLSVAGHETYSGQLRKV